ncbi:type II toxin-antitoxin system VapC family toxin [Aestuariimicrobium sp. Y1814]|uniref:type II toxin-antitoxin system VapC family toxin n=1 Tax=Aestuariimicrobium sp. Y1814 TaxID=3418742 RepID=UPI003DA6F310
MILIDTAPIVAAAFRTEEHYEVCTELFTGLHLAGRRLLLPATVVAEVGYLLDRLGGPELEAGFLEGIAEGAFEVVNLTRVDFTRMAELVRQYDDMRLGTTDASLIALAERLKITEVATLDRRHFAAVRPRHIEALSLLPERL